MKRTPIAIATAAVLLAATPALADEPVIVIPHLAANEDLHSGSDAWKRWADDFSRELRTSMGTMFAPRLGSGKVVKGAPYSAQVITESNQALADGNVISRKTQGAIYRDGEGRTRQESPGDGKQQTIFISDPVEGKQYVLSPGGKRAVSIPRVAEFKEHFKDKQVIRLDGTEVRVEDGKVFVNGKHVQGKARVHLDAGGKTIRVEDGKITVDGKEIGAIADAHGHVDKVVVKTIDAHESGDGTRREEVRVQVIRAGDGVAIPIPPIPPMPPMPPGALSAPLTPLPPMPGLQTFRFDSTAKLGKGVATKLGMRDFDGVKAEGKSTVWTIAAGEVGNRNPINVTSESWYAPDLQVTVYARHNDPRTGETVYRLSGIRREEPAADLFRVPEDYKVKSRAKG